MIRTKHAPIMVNQRKPAIIAAPGVAVGPAAPLDEGSWTYARSTCVDPSLELEKLERALKESGAELEQVRQQLEKRGAISEADVIDAQVLFLQDASLTGRARDAIRQGLNAEAAWMDAIEAFASRIETLPNPTLAERAADVRDAGHRVLSHLQGQPYQLGLDLRQPSIIVARDLTPSQTALLDRSQVLGFCTARGGPTSHTAIFARALGLPALVGLGDELLSVPPGSILILDAESGQLIVNPDEDLYAEYCRRTENLAQTAQEALQACQLPAATLDGHTVQVFANIGGLDGADLALARGAEGVGLLRTEFLFLERSTLPDEDEQFQAYSAILDAFGDRPIILRTADVGGDKPLPYLDLPTELNPFLGMRGIRLALAQPSRFLEPQLRAALRAGCGHDLRIMFPMVTTIQEVREARRAVESCRLALLQAGQQVAEKVQVGIMVEVPSAAILADQLAREVDFFSIGTNDLTQYVLAADRTNAQIARLGSAFSPAVLRLVRYVTAQAHRYGKRVGVCGELAGEPLAVPILLGLDVDELSMNPAAIPVAKRIIRTLSLPDCRRLAAEVQRLESGDEVRACVSRQLPGLAGD